MIANPDLKIKLKFYEFENFLLTEETKELRKNIEELENKIKSLERDNKNLQDYYNNTYMMTYSN